LKYYDDYNDDDNDCIIMNADEPQISTGFLHAKKYFLNSFEAKLHSSACW